MEEEEEEKEEEEEEEEEETYIRKFMMPDVETSLCLSLEQHNRRLILAVLSSRKRLAAAR